MIIRTIRDIFTGEVDAIYIDEPAAYERAKEFLQIVMPRYVNRLQFYEGKEPLFHKYNLDDEIAHDPARKVPLRGKAGRSSSIRPRPWSPSTSTAATSAPTTPPKKPPIR